MIMIRLSRFGRKNLPSFRIVVQEKRRAPSSKVLETIGHYNPLTHPATFVVKADRVQHWMKNGAQLSNSLHNLLVEHKVIEGAKRDFVKVKKSDAAPEAATPAAAAPAEQAAPAAEKAAA